jgi:hypothetical protein
MTIVATQRVPQASRLALGLLPATGLAVDAYLHAGLAPVYDGIHGSISQGDLFRIDAGAAALIVLAAAGRPAAAA